MHLYFSIRLSYLNRHQTHPPRAASSAEPASAGAATAHGKNNNHTL